MPTKQKSEYEEAASMMDMVCVTSEAFTAEKSKPKDQQDAEFIDRAQKGFKALGKGIDSTLNPAAKGVNFFTRGPGAYAVVGGVVVAVGHYAYKAAKAARALL